MLVLTRKEGQAILIDGGIIVRIRRIRGKQVSITIAAPQEVAIIREELTVGTAEGRSGEDSLASF